MPVPVSKEGLDGLYAIFEQYVRKLDMRFHRQDRKVELIIDSCPAHLVLKIIKQSSFFLPAIATSKNQAINQELIRALQNVLSLISC